MRGPGPTTGAARQRFSSEVDQGQTGDQDSPVLPALRAVRLRAEHPQGYRLFDYRPDLLVLLTGFERLCELHHRTSLRREGRPCAYCSACLCAWPCPTTRVLVKALRAVRAVRGGRA
jgi:hypothetical protein